MNKLVWFTKPITDEADAQHLDQVSDELGRHAAYNQYKRRKHKEAANFHHERAVILKNLNPLDSNRHKAMYEAHCAANGLKASYPQKEFVRPGEFHVFEHHPADKLL